MRSQDQSQEIILCFQCSQHLVNVGDSKEANKNEYTWPAFIWSILNNDDIVREYGVSIWRFIPETWRHWWIGHVTESLEYLSDVTIDSPSPIFDDRTAKIIKWYDGMATQHLPTIKITCNKLLFHTVLCPWGCTEYLHK